MPNSNDTSDTFLIASLTVLSAIEATSNIPTAVSNSLINLPIKFKILE